MFADPAVVTINAVDKPLIRIKHDDYSSEYLLRSATDEMRLHIRNTTYTNKKDGKRVDRHNVELIQTVFPVAPATSSTVRKTYAVIENQVGDTLTDPKNVALGLFEFLTGSNIDKLMNQES